MKRDYLISPESEAEYFDWLTRLREVVARLGEPPTRPKTPSQSLYDSSDLFSSPGPSPGPSPAATPYSRSPVDSPLGTPEESSDVRLAGFATDVVTLFCV